jgi:hypothetical protein
MLIDYLLDVGVDLFHPESVESQKKEVFLAIQESLSMQYVNNALFHQYCKLKKFYPLQDLKSEKDFSAIPYLTTASFKKFTGRAKSMLLVPEESIKVWGISRGTFFDTSMVGRDEITINRLLNGLNIMFNGVLNLPKYDWALFFFPPFQLTPNESHEPIKVMHFNFCLDQIFKNTPEGNIIGIKIADPKARNLQKRFALDPEIIIKTLTKYSQEQKPGVIFGLVPAIFGALSEYNKKTNKTFALHPDTKVVTFGGWMMPNGQIISPEIFRNQVGKILNLSEQNIRDIYGFTETDALFAQCEHHRMHVPPWIEIIVRDVETLKPKKVGEKGIFQIINPMPFSYAGVSILQDDVIRILPEKQCPCGRHGTMIEVFGPAL